MKRSPTNADHWYNLGVAEHRMDRRAQAEEAYRRSLALEPDHPDARRTLAYDLSVRAYNAAQAGSDA